MSTNYSTFVKRYDKDLLKKNNVVGVGYTTDEDNGAVIIVNVTRKLPLTQLHRADLIPEEIHGYKTKVVESGIIRALMIDPTEKFRPAFGGISIGHPDITAGTLGVVVTHNPTGRRVILSNNHVLAASNNANLGDPILQPGAFDGGILADTIGSLEDYVEIDFGGAGGGGGFCTGIAFLDALLCALFGIACDCGGGGGEEPQSNFVDAAICMPTNDEDVEDRIEEIGLVSGITEAELGMQLRKYGRTTQFTTGTIQQLGATVDVDYGNGRVARFEDQILTSAMSEGGDSGSAVLEMGSNNLVGLLYAGSPQVTVLNRMSKVFELLDLSIS